MRSKSILMCLFKYDYYLFITARVQVILRLREVPVTTTARSMFRSISESPDAFGSMQAKIHGMIPTLIAVSSMIDDYVCEQRFDEDTAHLLLLHGAKMLTGEIWITATHCCPHG